MRVALVGYGSWGPNLARCIAAAHPARLAAICDRSPGRAQAARSAHPGVPVVGDVDVLLKDPGIDALVVATPPATHGALARRALKRGKHVLVEKPLADSSVDARAAAAASQRSGLLLMVDHTYVFSPAWKVIRQLVVDRGLGPLRGYRSNRLNCRAPGHPARVLWDLAVHDLYLLDELLPGPPVSLRALAPGDAGDHPAPEVQLLLRYPEQASASVRVSWSAPAKARTITLDFDHHAILWDDLSAASKVQLFERGVGESIPVPSSEPLAGAVAHFLDCLAHGAPCRSGAASGLRTVRLLEAAEQSLAGSGEPVSIEAAGAAT